MSALAMTCSLRAGVFNTCLNADLLVHLAGSWQPPSWDRTAMAAKRAAFQLGPNYAPAHIFYAAFLARGSTGRAPKR